MVDPTFGWLDKVTMLYLRVYLIDLKIVYIIRFAKVGDACRTPRQFQLASKAVMWKNGYSDSERNAIQLLGRGPRRIAMGIHGFWPLVISQDSGWMAGCWMAGVCFSGVFPCCLENLRHVSGDFPAARDLGS